MWNWVSVLSFANSLFPTSCDFNHACTHVGNNIFDWDTLRDLSWNVDLINETAVFNVHDQLTSQLHTFQDVKQYEKATAMCPVGHVALHVMVQRFCAPESLADYLAAGVPWKYLKSLTTDLGVSFEQIVLSGWNLFGLYRALTHHRFGMTLENAKDQLANFALTDDPLGKVYEELLSYMLKGERAADTEHEYVPLRTSLRLLCMLGTFATLTAKSLCGPSSSSNISTLPLRKRRLRMEFDFHVEVAAHFAVADAKVAEDPGFSDAELPIKHFVEGGWIWHLQRGQALLLNTLPTGNEVRNCSDLHSDLHSRADPASYAHRVVRCSTKRWSSAFAGLAMTWPVLERISRRLALRAELGQRHSTVDEDICVSSAAMGYLCSHFKFQSDWFLIKVQSNNAFDFLRRSLGLDNLWKAKLNEPPFSNDDHLRRCYDQNDPQCPPTSSMLEHSSGIVENFAPRVLAGGLGEKPIKTDDRSKSVEREAYVTILFASERAEAEAFCDAVRTLAEQLRRLEVGECSDGFDHALSYGNRGFRNGFPPSDRCKQKLRRPLFVLSDSKTLGHGTPTGDLLRQQLVTDGISLVQAELDFGSGGDLLHERARQLQIVHPPLSAWLKVRIFDEDLFGNFSRVIYLDADTLPLGGAVRDLLSLPSFVAFASARMPLYSYLSHGAPAFNTAVMVARPNKTLYTIMMQKLQQAWLLDDKMLERTRNFDQTWLDVFWRHFSLRISVDVPPASFHSIGLSLSEGSGKLEEERVFSEVQTRYFLPLNGTFAILPAHVVLPESFNFFVDPLHAKVLLDELTSHHYSVPKGGQVLRTAADPLRALGHGGASVGPRVLHWPGFYAKPWWRCDLGSRNQADDLWWNVHDSMCDRLGGCFFNCPKMIEPREGRKKQPIILLRCLILLKTIVPTLVSN